MPRPSSDRVTCDVFVSLICNIIRLLRVSNTVISVCLDVARNPLPPNAKPSYIHPNPSFAISVSPLLSVPRWPPLDTLIERTWAPPPTGTSVPPPSSASPLISPLTSCPLPRWRPATGKLLLRPWVLRSPCSSLVSLRRLDLVSDCLLFPSNRS
jgi:hypothetical protein